jgi:hypothetical protein
MGTKAARAERERLILSLLPANCDQLAAATDIPPTSMWRLVREMHADGEIHVTAWALRAGGGKPVATYSAGSGEDVPCVLPTPAERKRERRKQRAAAVPVPAREPWLRPQDRKRELAIADRTAKTRDPMIEALFGPAKRAA